MQDKAAPPLSVPHRLAILYLMLPLVIWLVGWFQWWFGIPMAALIALGLWRALSGSWRVSLRPTDFVLLLMAAGWVAVTAVGGAFDVNYIPIWSKHRAIFLDLSTGDWPTYLPSYLESPPLLRYYLGYYLVPGLLGNSLGVATLNWAVPLWTWCGVALILILFTWGHRGWTILVAALILIFFSGIDIVQVALFEGRGWLEVSVNLEGWTLLRLGQWSAWSGPLELPDSYFPPIVNLMCGAPTLHSWRSLCLALVAAAQGAEIPVGKWNPARDKSLMVALCGDSLAAAGHSFGYCERRAVTHSMAERDSGNSDCWTVIYVPDRRRVSSLSLWLGMDSLQ